MNLKLRVGKKGTITLPKEIRENADIKEGDEVLVELGDTITPKPIKIDIEKLREAYREHDKRLQALNTSEPQPGDLEEIYLEEEFEECLHS